MLLNYFKVAIRSINRFKGYTIINLTGLALGLTAGVLILVYVLDELSFDSFHARKDRIFRVDTELFNARSGGAEGSMDANGWAVGTVLKRDYPEVESVLYSRNAFWLTVNHDGRRIREKSHFVSAEFFSMFSFPLLKGNTNTALTEPFSVVISESLATKYFPGSEPLNASLTMGDSLSFVVTGVMADVPSNSHIQADMLISFSTYTSLNKEFDYDGGWGNINVRNYILLKEGVDVPAFKARAKNIYMDHAGGMLGDWGVSAQVVIRPLNRLYLTASNGNGMGPTGSLQRLYLLSGIALFVIALACINFINLATARAVYRAREVGLRKVVGSTRQILIRQFLTESFLLTLISFLFAIALVGVTLPAFNALLGKSYSLISLLQPEVLLAMGVLIIFVSLLAGYYPAIVLSGMRPVDVLKGKLQSNRDGVNLRRSLVVFQFMISICLVLGTLVVVEQLNFMQKQELGFAKDELIVINAANARSANALAFESLKNELSALATVENVSFTNSLPGNPGWIGQIAYPEGKSGDEAISVEYMAVDENYVQTLGLELVDGKSFDLERPADLETGLILNEKAIAMFGWSSPEDAIGKMITSPSGYPAGEVIGVVRDYHQFGLRHEIGPMVMDYNPKASSLYAIRYKAADTRLLISSLGNLWKKHFPGYDFNYFFVDQDFERQYQSEQRLAKVFGIFAGVTIIIALIGLLGLVSFMVEAKTKEIGIRKVLGANVLSLTNLLSKEFLTLVALANLIAIPLAWYFADRWLQNFATRVEIDPLLFATTFGLGILITAAMVSIQTVKAAMADPVRSLRYE